jgi:hypothetical protein
MPALKLADFSIKSLFQNKYEFELSDLGDLSQYSFNELAQKMTNFKISISSFQDHFIANFESRSTVISIKYCSLGNFMSIVNQNWL